MFSLKMEECAARPAICTKIAPASGSTALFSNPAAAWYNGREKGDAEMKFGTIGSGVIVQHILEGMQHAEGMQAAAVYSRTQERGAQLAAQFGIEKVYTDLAAMLADPELDWIYIASPNSLHYAQARAALEAGKHVLLEKPFASTAREAEELQRLALEQGLWLLEALTTVHLPNYRRLQRALPQIGRLRLVLCDYCQRSARYDQLLAGQTPNVFNPAFSGGALMDINYYNVAFAVQLFGEPEEVSYTANFVRGIDTSGVAVLRYPDFVCQCTGAKDTWGRNNVQLEGEDGYLLLAGGSNGLTGLRVITKEHDEVLAPEDPAAEQLRWRREMAEIAAMVRRDDRAEMERLLRGSVATVRTVERLRRSAGLRFPADEAEEA